MKCQISKPALLILLMMIYIPVVGAFDNSEGNLKLINSIDHNSHHVVVGDKRYIMPINFKVYKLDRYVQPYRVVNRYALKVGQSVYVNTRVSSSKAYVDELLIVEDSP